MSKISSGQRGCPGLTSATGAAPFLTVTTLTPFTHAPAATFAAALLLLTPSGTRTSAALASALLAAATAASLSASPSGTAATSASLPTSTAGSTARFTSAPYLTSPLPPAASAATAAFAATPQFLPLGRAHGLLYVGLAFRRRHPVPFLGAVNSYLQYGIGTTLFPVFAEEVQEWIPRYLARPVFHTFPIFRTVTGHALTHGLSIHFIQK